MIRGYVTSKLAGEEHLYNVFSSIVGDIVVYDCLQQGLDDGEKVNIVDSSGVYGAFKSDINQPGLLNIPTNMLVGVTRESPANTTLSLIGNRLGRFFTPYTRGAVLAVDISNNRLFVQLTAGSRSDQVIAVSIGEILGLNVEDFSIGDFVLIDAFRYGKLTVVGWLYSLAEVEEIRNGIYAAGETIITLCDENGDYLEDDGENVPDIISFKGFDLSFESGSIAFTSKKIELEHGLGQLPDDFNGPTAFYWTIDAFIALPNEIDIQYIYKGKLYSKSIDLGYETAISSPEIGFSSVQSFSGESARIEFEFDTEALVLIDKLADIIAAGTIQANDYAAFMGALDLVVPLQQAFAPEEWLQVFEDENVTLQQATQEVPSTLFIDFKNGSFRWRGEPNVPTLDYEASGTLSRRRGAPIPSGHMFQYVLNSRYRYNGKFKHIDATFNFINSPAVVALIVLSKPFVADYEVIE